MESHKLPRTVWDYLFYLSMLIATIWLILKVTGVINTPIWLEYGVPLGSFILGFVTFYQVLIDKNQLLLDKIIVINTTVARLETHILHMDRDIELLKNKS